MLVDYFILMHAPPGTPYYEVLDSVTAQAEMAERTGASTLWLSEHHFGGAEGFDLQPNPILTAMHLSRYVSEIRLGIAALILPEWHPLRVAEDVAILDHSLKGRLEVGIAKGITNREISNLNPFEVDRRFPEANDAMFLEMLDIMKKAWTEDSFTYNGHFYKFPKAGVSDSRAKIRRLVAGSGVPGEEYLEMSIVPKPYQQPHPPLWVVGDTDHTFATAARNGCKAITWLRSWQALRGIFETYREAASEVRGTQLALGEDVALMRCCFVAPTTEKAREIAEPRIETVFRDFLGGGDRGRGIFAEPGEVITEEEAAGSWYDFLDDRGHLLVGSPDDVIEKIKKTQDWVGLERLLLWTWLPGIPGMPLSDVLSSMELFAKEVLPCLE